MKYERATYSRSAVNTAARMVKSINWTCKRKNEYFALYMELEKIYTYCCDHVNKWLFDPDGDLKALRLASYDYKNYNKSEIDSMLQAARRHVSNELNEIWQLINSGEVNVID